MPDLTSPHLRLSVSPSTGRLDFVAENPVYPRIHQALCRITLTINGSRVSQEPVNWEEQPAPMLVPDYLQPVQTASYTCEMFNGQLHFEIDLVVPQRQPAVLWRIRITNTGSAALQVEQIDLLRAGGRSDRGKVEFPSGRLSFYRNGWQSWSHTGSYLTSQPMVKSNLGLLQNPMVLNSGTPLVSLPGYYTSDFFGTVNALDAQTGLLLGFLSQTQHFGTLEALLYDQPGLALWANGDATQLDPNASQQSDWATLVLLDLNTPDPLHGFLEMAAQENDVQLPARVPAGWCSWYQYYTHLSAQDIRNNLASLNANAARLPLDLVQIDDGFETQVGDWFSFKPGFPDGFNSLVKEIRASGKTPGLWLAPFIVHPKSRLEAEHPEYILRDRRGKPVNAGFVWNALTHGLDLTHPAALDYTREVIATAVQEWGFPYLKLDFLYAAALPGRYQDPTRTRAQVLRMGMETIRAAAGAKTFLLGCGAPLGSVLGLVEANRISADVSGDWRPAFAGIQFPFRNEPGMPSARNAIQNILTRSPLHQTWWVNDPDCLLVRPDTHLSLAEVQSLATAIAMTGGSLLLSDDLPAVPEDRLKIAQSLLPVTGRSAQVIDLFERTAPTLLRLDCAASWGSWHVLARFNWGDQPLPWKLNPADFKLEDRPYRAASFWDESFYTLTPGTALELPPIAPHGVSLLALYPHEPGLPGYSGSSLHFTQGMEVTAWQATAEKINLELQIQRADSGRVTLWLPSAPMFACANGEAVRWQPAGDGHYHFYLDIYQSVCLEITRG